VKSSECRSHHHVERWLDAVWRLQGGSVVRKAGNDEWIGCSTTQNRTVYLQK
jgi:hypothetical protein